MLNMESKCVNAIYVEVWVALGPVGAWEEMWVLDGGSSSSHSSRPVTRTLIMGRSHAFLKVSWHSVLDGDKRELYHVSWGECICIWRKFAKRYYCDCNPIFDKLKCHLTGMTEAEVDAYTLFHTWTVILEIMIIDELYFLIIILKRIIIKIKSMVAYQNPQICA